MRFSVRAKISTAMGIALLLALTLGVTGIAGVKQTFALVQDIYRSNVLAILAVDEAQKAIVDERSALNRAIIDPSTHNTRERMHADETQEATAWASYYPGMISTDDEHEAAKKYIALREAALPLLEKEAALLDEGKTDQARALHLASTADALAAWADAVGTLTRINARQAAAAEDAAAAQYATTRAIAIGLLVLSVVVLLGVALLVIRAVVRPLTRARALALAIQGGQLNNGTLVSGNDEFTDTLRAMDEMDRRLASIVSDVRRIAEEVSSSAADISQGNDDLSQRTQEQASSLEETAASMEELATAVKQNADGAEQARQLSQRVRSDAERGSAVSSDATDAMAAITLASHQIGEIVGLIDEIAFQTNLLALNAAVEAARAGDQGRGFAVVATEVRNLAQRSGTAAREIKQLVGTTVERVELGSSLVTQTGKALQSIASGVREVNTVVDDIAASSQEQAAGINQVNNAVVALDDVTQQNAALVEEASAASKQAADLSRELLRQVAFFTVAGDALPTALPVPGAPPAAVRPVVIGHRMDLAMAGPGAGDTVWKEF